MSKIREYEVDLSQPASKRWKPLFEQEGERARELVNQVLADAYEVAEQTLFGGWWLKKFKNKLLKWYKDDPLFLDDASAISAELGIHLRDLIAVNLSYEISQALEHGQLPSYGCTAVAFPYGKVMYHARNMDWPLVGVGPATVVLNFKGAKAGPFTSIGWAGYLGVLSGVAQGRFAITINQAPQADEVNSNGVPAHMLVRDVFERCKNYDEAVDLLEDTQLAASTLFMVTGPKPSQAAVIEHTGVASCRREIKRAKALSVSNHYQVDELTEHNHGEPVGEEEEDTSEERAEEARLEGVACNKSGDLNNMLKGGEVKNGLTCQRMLLCASTGDYELQTYNTDKAVKEQFAWLANA